MKKVSGHWRTLVFLDAAYYCARGLHAWILKSCPKGSECVSADPVVALGATVEVAQFAIIIAALIYIFKAMQADAGTR